VDILCDVVRTRQVKRFCPWPHRNEAVTKSGLICDCQCLGNQHIHLPLKLLEYLSTLRTWSSQATNRATACKTPSRVNSTGPVVALNAPSSFPCCIAFGFFFASWSSFHICRGSAWWFSGMFSSLHRCLYSP
jgi:hypothetical protein